MGQHLSTNAFADEGCPVDHKNMSQEEIDQMMAQYKKMGQHHPTNSTKDQKSTSTQSSPPQTEDSDSKCPVDQKNMSKEQVQAYMSRHKQPTASKEEAATVYDVYGQELSKANLMPATPNQLPSPGQKDLLSTDREKSSIPKSGGRAHETWTYPSPQMFYNALKRKGKADGVEETDMDTVVSVHNSMNEKTWNEVVDWEERYHCSTCTNPKLMRFKGRPHDLSPAAWFRTTFMGYPMPFDRHDWIVDRCGKEQARYIIDYYYREGPDPIEIHVRPALDSPTAMLDRMQRGIAGVRDRILGDVQEQKPLEEQTFMKHITEEFKDGWVRGQILDKREFQFLSNLTPQGVQDIAEDVQKRCSKVSEAFREAGDDPQKMEKANVKVNYCMAQRICKPQADEFMSVLEKGGNETEVYDKMTSCLERFHIMARRTLLEAAGVAQSGPEFPAGVTPSVGRSSPSPAPAPASGIE